MAETNRFKHITDAYRELYLSFIKSGFTEAEAFTLITFYLSQSNFETLDKEERVRKAQSAYMKKRYNEEVHKND